MRIKSKDFGEIDIDDSSIIEFKDGMLGFGIFKKYALINIENEGFESFFCLQSIDEPALSFIIVDLSQLIPEYDPLVDEHILKNADFDINSIEIYNTITLSDTIEHTTVNLKAPIIINANKGVQVICQNDDYSVKSRLFKELV